MRTRKLLQVWTTLALLLGIFAMSEASASADPFSPHRKGVVLVGFDAGVSGARRHAIESRASLSPRPRTLTRGARAVLRRRRPQRIGAVAALRVRAGSELDTAGELARLDGVRFAEPDYVLRGAGVPNDPSFGLQWGFRNTGQDVNGKAGIAGADEHAVPAWDVQTGSRSIVIGEVDSGVDYNHPDLASNVWTNPGGIGGCPAGTRGRNVVANTCDPMDDDTAYNGHGTHVAGILGARGDNGIGVTGVNRQTTILPVKWLNSSSDGYTSDLIAGLDWLVQAKNAGVNVRVVNDSATFVGTAYSQALADEIDVLGANDILFVTAAGNTGEDNDDPAKRRYPCGYNRPTAICVTASDQQDGLPSWANYGAKTVDLAAPGDNIYSTLRGGAYGYISGGSMASPQVAGAAALMLAGANQSAVALKSSILGNVDVLPSLTGKVRTGGRLNICRALAGCAEADDDGDGLANAADSCPGAAATTPDGCPIPPAVSPAPAPAVSAPAVPSAPTSAVSPDKTPPAFVLGKLARTIKLRALTATGIKFKIRPKEAARGGFAIKYRQMRVGKLTKALGARTHIVSIRPSKTAAKQMARVGKGKVQLVGTLTDRAGNVSRFKRTIAFKR